MYVAEFDLGVLPMGDWSMSITLSAFSIPEIFLNLPGYCFDLIKSDDSALYNISITRDDFPEPDTPVTDVIMPRGNFTLILLRLFSLAPKISINPDGSLLLSGIFMNDSPLK